jgi:MFS transporter, DHA1 family, multidrug resistance protein
MIELFQSFGRPRKRGYGVRGSEFGQIAMLGAMSALPPLAIDMGLPALTTIQADLGGAAGEAGLTLSLFMAGFAITPLLYGTLSDRQGRRPLLLAGLVLFTLAGIACAFAPSIEFLLWGRLVQGAGAGAGTTIAFAALRDRFNGRALGSRLSILTMVINTAPMIAPSLGAGILAAGGWRGIYGLLAVAGGAMLVLAWARFAETHTPPAAPRPVWSGLGEGVLHLFRRRASLAHCAVYGLSFGAMFSYVAGSPHALIDGFGISSALYAILFGLTALGIVAGAFLSSRLALRQGSPARILVAGQVGAFLAPLAVLGLEVGGQATLGRVMPLLTLATFSYGVIAPVASRLTLEPVPEVAGLAAAVMNTVQMICGALCSALVAVLIAPWGDAAMPATMAGFALCSLAARPLLMPRRRRGAA